MQPTQALFYTDPFARRFDSVVAAVDRTGPAPRVALEATLFYPEGGGQPCDTGLLWFAGQDEAGWAVTDTRRQGEVIWHTLSTLEGKHPLPDAVAEGCPTHGELNWGRRFDHMQQHTGEHILSGTLHRLFGAENVGFHIGETAVRMDTSVPLTWEQLRAAERQANQVIWDDVPITAVWHDQSELAALTYRSKKELEGAVRIVTIPGGDVCACAGTHLARSGQVGAIKIIAAEHYKGGERLTVLCGRRALEEYEAMRDRQQQIGALLSAKADGTAHAVRRMQDENARLSYDYYGVCRQLFELLAEKAALTPDAPAIVTVPGLDPAGLSRLANRLAQAVPGLCAALTGTAQGTGYCIASSTLDVRPLTKALNAARNGRGGGKPHCCQGSCTGAEPRQVEEFLRSMCSF